MTVLVTGGAGFIGSIVVEQLAEQGNDVVVFDNLYQGHIDAVHPNAKFIKGDLADVPTLRQVFVDHDIESIMHFASYTLVGESVSHPFMYLGENVTNGLNLLHAATDNGVKHFILSSTANLFDDPETIPIAETERIVPGSPYGESKYILERFLHWLDKTKDLRYTALRYFNAAGASVERGEHHDPETHIIPLVLDVARGRRDKFTIFGNDYDTHDGTCVRDYIHVLDLAQAHILSLNALKDGGPSRKFNLGNGNGFSILELIEVARKITGHSIPTVFGERRPGDPDILIADSKTIRKDLGWQPQRPDLEAIIGDAWNWFQKNPNGYSK
ncbi:UDP-glucose 4-epimerase GalE [Anaerolineales bacterium HSG24]|nr:UDP-glucose 4-epimerase GalE [Anaerolineales bacterium HSG24]